MDLMDYRRKIIANSPHLKSASGAVVSFSDGADLPLKSLNVGIEPVQSGTGDPSPTNVRPISGWNGVKVTRCGKNLWNPVSSYPATSNGVTYSRNADGSIHVQGTASGQSNNYPIASNGMSVYAGTYTMSVKTTDPNIHFIFGGGNGTAGIAYTDMVNGSKKTFTTNGGTTGHNIVRINPGATVNGDIYIQLEHGTVATEWELYVGQDVTISLGQTVYGATLNPLTGVLTVDRAIWELGTEGWSKSSSYSGGFYRAHYNFIFNNITAKKNTPFICSHAKTANTIGEYAKGTCYCDNSINIRIMPDDATVQDWVDYITTQKTNGTPMQISAYLTTPFTVQLSSSQIKTLYGNNTIFADTGNVALEYWAHP